ncbi:protein of unknown function [Pararobbsia alpina]
MPSAVRPVRTRSWRASTASRTSSSCCRRFRKRTAREALTHRRSAKGLCGTCKRAPNSLFSASNQAACGVCWGDIVRDAANAACRYETGANWTIGLLLLREIYITNTFLAAVEPGNTGSSGFFESVCVWQLQNISRRADCWECHSLFSDMR